MFSWGSGLKGHSHILFFFSPFPKIYSYASATFSPLSPPTQTNKMFFWGDMFWGLSYPNSLQIWLHDLFPWIQRHNVALLLPTDLFTPFVQVSLFGMQSPSPLTMPPLQTHLCGFSHLSPTPWIPSCLLSAGHTFYPIAHWCPPPYKLATHWACTWFICIIQSPWRQLCYAQFCSSHNSKHHTYKS